MEIKNYWYDNLGTAYYKKQNDTWSRLLLDKYFFVDADDETKSTLFKVQKSSFGSLENLSNHTEILTYYINYLHEPLVGVKFDNTKASSKPYFDCLKELKRRDVVIYGENIFRYGILIDPNITINNSRVRTWFLDIEIDNFSQDTELSMQQVVDNALSKLLSITIYDTLAKRYVALIVDPVGSITEQRTKDTDKIILIFKTEKSMLNYFVKLLKESQPYIISGWYSNEFDIPFLINKVKNEFNDQTLLSLIEGLSTDIYVKKSNTGEVQHFNKIPGIELIDYMDLYLKYSGKNPPSKSLDGVAKFEEISGKTESKGFLNYYDDFDKFIDYIFRDVEVLVELENSKRLIQMITALQELVKIPLSQIMHTSRMVEQMIYHSTFTENIVIPSYVRYKGDGGYQGAIVLDPEDNTFDNVVVLDYASLYPNTIITFNISPDTLLKDKQLDEAIKQGIPCSNLTTLMNNEKVGYRMDFMGMIPKAVKMLIDKRMEYKKLYKNAKDDDPNKVEYDLKQWNYKIIINSIYGYLGYRFSPLFDTTVSGSVTAQSRYMLTTCVDLVNTSPVGATVIYGDSVQGDSNVIIKIDNKIKEIQIKELFANVDYKINNKEYSNCNNIEVLTMDDNGNNVFKPIKYIMRHNSNKQMYRVQTTNINYIDVTEDHSIITMNKDMNLCYTKPNNFDSKQYLIFNNKIPYQINSRQYSKELYQFLGLFLGDGSIWKTNNKYYYCSLSQGKDLDEILSKIIIPLQTQGWIKHYWVKQKNDITINGLNLVRMIQDVCLDINNKKMIPEFIYSETPENISNFISGLFQSDGTVIMRGNTPIVRFTNTNYNLIRGMSMLLHQLGISNSYFMENNYNNYNGKYSNTKSMHLIITNIEKFKSVGLILDRKNDRIINYKRTVLPEFITKDFNIKHPKSITPIDYCDYVYDIEVETIHRFYANGILVHNTDSQFSVLNKYNHKENANKDEIEQVQNILSKYINNQLLDRILTLFYNIEKNKIQNTLQVDVDKIFKKLRLFGVKKRYYGVDFKNNEIFQGIELARSDTPQSVKPMLSDFFKKQLYNKLDKEELLNKYNEIKEFPLSDIGTPKSITQLNLSNYKVIPGHVRGMLFAKQIGIQIPDVITDKLLQIPIIIYKNYNVELFEKAKEIFNLKSKNATELNCIISILPDLIDNTIDIIQSLEGFIKIDYFTFYNKQVLEKMTQFSELRPMIEEIQTVIMQLEYKDKQGKNLTLFSMG